MSRALVAVSFILVLLAGCGRKPDGETWMVVAGTDTVTVSEIGRAWLALSPEAQQRFLSGENPLGDFLLSFARKLMVEDEIARLGYLGREGISLRSQAWGRLEMFHAAQETLQARAEADFTDEDLAFFRNHMGTTVWYTVTSSDGDTRYGPDHLAELSSEVGAALAGLEPGETATLDLQVTVTLDSIDVTDSALVAQALADTTQIEDYARTQISRRRAVEQYDEILAAAWAASPPEINFAGLARFAAWSRGEAESLPSDTLITAGDAVWTAARMIQEAGFESTMRPTASTDTTWLREFSTVLINRQFIADELRRISPSDADSILSRSSKYAKQLAADSLYGDFVVDSVTVSEAQTDSAWAASPPAIPEMRSVECVLLPSEADLEAFRNAIVRGDAGRAAEQYQGIPGICPDGGRLTRPLESDEIPCGLGDTLFSLAPADTLRWVGPAAYAPVEGYVALRLVEVLPAHASSREEAGPILEGLLRSVFLEERLNAWLGELERFYGLSINERALNDLPSDPSLWADMPR